MEEIHRVDGFSLGRYDRLNWYVARPIVTKEGKTAGETRMLDVTYYSTFSEALKGLARRVVDEEEGASLLETAKRIEERQEALEELIENLAGCQKA